LSRAQVNSYVPHGASLAKLERSVQGCKGCELYKNATQAVFGEGPAAARVMLVGEQPGDQEDLAGTPFVGPAGRVLNRALEEAGIARGDIYVTNAVKHFKFEPRGKRRIHQRPTSRELAACRPWLEEEAARVAPLVLVALGATAARSIFGPLHRLTEQHGTLAEHPWASRATSTYHPSAVLRSGPDSSRRDEVYQAIVSDLKRVRELL
jgi:uracil-DNA glycosylase